MKNFQLVIAIAAALNGTWEAKAKGYDYLKEDDDRWHRIVAPNGAGVFIHFPAEGTREKDQRISITGIWPTRAPRPHGAEVGPSSLYPRQDAPTIYISLKKSPEQIAKDIERRFLPVYLPLWEACCDKAAETETAEAKELARKEEITAILGGKLTDQEKRPDSHIGRYADLPDKMYIQDIYVSSETVSLDIRSIPYDLALKVLKLVKAGV
jgi:hypothetical protein